MNDFQIFGSKSSLDLDCMVFVDSIPSNPYDGIKICKEYDVFIKDFIGTHKEVNSNLVIVENGVVKKVLKGTEDECNNSMFYTFDLHTQYIK